MKRLGNIFDLVIDRENLAAAFNRVCKGKRNRRDIRQFAENLEENLNSLHRELADGAFRFGKYNFFKIHDPKERTIAAAPVKERIVHHALIAVIGGRLERALVDKSYACRHGKGQWAAVAEARRLAGRHTWCLKMDVKSFFDSIDHAILLRLIARKIKDKRVMALVRQLVQSYETAPGRGLPIGNLTSQYFANLYLDGLDRFVEAARSDRSVASPKSGALRGRARCPQRAARGSGTLAASSIGHVRYMDDVLVFGGHDELRALMKDVPGFLRETLNLELKPTGGLHRTARGVDFLGTRIFPDCVELARSSKVRFRRKVALLDGMLASGMMSERRYQTRMTQIFAFVRNCDTEALRRKVILESGQGELTPRSRRMLERQQQRGLCCRVPLRVSQLQLQQQQQPEPDEQLLGLSRCLSPSSSKADGTHLNRPFSSTAAVAARAVRAPYRGGQTQTAPCGAGRRAADAGRPPCRAERHAGILSEQVAVRSEAKADEFQTVFHDLVDEDKVGLDMAVAIPRVVAGERMVVERRWKRLLGAEKVDDLCDLPQVLAAPDCPHKVSGELLLEDACEHGGQSSISNAAFSISSVLLNGPYDGSSPAMSRSRTARVSALGYSFASSSSVQVSPRVMPCGKPRCSRVYMRRTFMPVDVVMPRREKRSSARRLISGLTRKAIVDVAIADAPICLTDANSLAQLPCRCKRCNALAARSTILKGTR